MIGLIFMIGLIVMIGLIIVVIRLASIPILQPLQLEAMGYEELNFCLFFFYKESFTAVYKSLYFRIIFLYNSNKIYENYQLLTEVNGCISDPCRNNGTCQSHHGQVNYTCSCQPMTSGLNCEYGDIISLLLSHAIDFFSFVNHQTTEKNR